MLLIMRSFLFPERSLSQHAQPEAVNARPVSNPTPQPKFENFFPYKEFSQRKNRAEKSKPTVWQTSHYLKRSKNRLGFFERSNGLPELQKKLHVDIRSLLEEYVAQRARLVYEYGPNGMRNGYTETMSQIAHNHVGYLESAGLGTARAKQEYAVAQAVEVWMATEDSSEKYLVSISPRGMPAEGYPGYQLENYALINVYERTGHGTFVLRQFRSYDSNADLDGVQRQLVHNCTGRIEDLPRVNPQHPELPLIARLLYLPEETSLSAITECVYQNKADWVVDIDKQLPDLPLEAYLEQQTALVTYCLDQFSQLYLDKQLSSEQISMLFDGLIELSISKLAKWVDDHAQNYDHSVDQPYQLDLQELDTAWTVQRKELLGVSLSTQERSVLDQFAATTQLAAGSPMGRLMSMAHCITGTPLSVIRPDILNAIQLNQLTHSQLVNVIGAERAKKWSEGNCRSCEKSGILVGECSICLHCELALGEQNSQQQEIDQLESFLLNAAAPQQRARALELHRQLTSKLFKQSIGVQDFLDSNYLDPAALSSTNTERADFSIIAQQLHQSANPMQTLEKIVWQLSENNNSNQNSTEVLVYQSKVNHSNQRSFN